jgi:uncharacterized membrane protein YfcA
MIAEILIVFVTGLFAGFIGSQAGGGGLLTLPVLLFIGLPAPVAIGTNRFSAMFLTLSATIQYIKKGKTKLKSILPYAILAMAGSLLGANIILNIDEILLKRIIALVLIATIIVFLYKKDLGLIDKKIKVNKKKKIGLSLLIFIISIYGGAIGVAAATIFTFTFVLFGKSFTQGMGYSLFLGFVLSLSATIFFIYAGVIEYKLAIPMAAGVSIGAWTGAKFAIKKGNQWVKYVFIIIAAIFTVEILLDTFA